MALALSAMAVSPSAPASSGRALKGAAYGGSSSQQRPLTLHVTADGKRVKTFLILSSRKCDSAAGSYNEVVKLGATDGEVVRVGPSGAFTIAAPAKEPVEDQKRLDSRVSVHGRLGRLRATGTYRLTGVLRDATGRILAHCDTGSIRWTALRGAVYSGATADGVPMNFRLARGEKKIASFLIGFSVRCGPATYFYALQHTDIAVNDSGRFSKQGLSGIPIKTPQGSTIGGRFSVSGVMRHGVATGRYRASGTVRLPGGQHQACDTGSVGWNARRG